MNELHRLCLLMADAADSAAIGNGMNACFWKLTGTTDSPEAASDRPRQRQIMDMCIK